MDNTLRIASSRWHTNEPGHPRVSSGEGAIGRHVAVIGAGAVGVAMAIRLTRMPAIAEIVMIDASAPGQGLAFGDHHEELLCNTPVEIMSLDPERPLEFADYLQARFGRSYATEFVPRRWFADYCVESFNRACASTDKRVRQVHARATRITRASAGYRIHTDNGTCLEATDVVVTAGAVIPRVPPGLEPYTNLPTITTSPYPVARLLESVGSRARVLVLGTKLTAVDVALVLGTRGRTVIMTSPSGRLPAVRTEMRPCPIPSVLDQIRRLRAADPRLAARLVDISVRSIRQATPVPLRQQCADGAGLDLLRRELRLAETGRTGWQTLMPTIAEVLNTSPWVAELPQSVRAALFERFHDVIARYLTAMPAINARRLVALADQAQVHIAGQYPERIQLDRSGWRIFWKQGTIHVDHLVCCIGYHQTELPILGTRCTPDPHTPGGHHINSHLQVQINGRREPDRIWLIGQRAGYRVAFNTLLRTNVQQVALVASAMQAAWSRTDTHISTGEATPAILGR